MFAINISILCNFQTSTQRNWTFSFVEILSGWKWATEATGLESRTYSKLAGEWLYSPFYLYSPYKRVPAPDSGYRHSTNNLFTAFITKPTNDIQTERLKNWLKIDRLKLSVSLRANTITTKLTNPFLRTRFITLDHRLWLWRWLPLKVSNSQPLTTVLFRTTLAQTK